MADEKLAEKRKTQANCQLKPVFVDKLLIVMRFKVHTFCDPHKTC